MGRGAATASAEELALEKYLPTPFPLQRLRPESGGGFLAPEPAVLSHQHFRSYGEWFEAQQPLWKKLPPKPLSRVQSTALWPFGRHVSQLTGSLAKSDAMSLDGRLVESTMPFVPPVMEKSSSSPALGIRSSSSSAGSRTRVALGSHEEVSQPRKPPKANPMNGHDPFEHLRHLFPQEARQQELKRRAASTGAQQGADHASGCRRPESAPGGLWGGDLQTAPLAAHDAARPQTAAGSSRHMLGCTTVYKPLPPPGVRPELRMTRERPPYKERQGL